MDHVQQDLEMIRTQIESILSANDDAHDDDDDETVFDDEHSVSFSFDNDTEPYPCPMTLRTNPLRDWLLRRRRQRRACQRLGYLFLLRLRQPLQRRFVELDMMTFLHNASTTTREQQFSLPALC